MVLYKMIVSWLIALLTITEAVSIEGGYYTDALSMDYYAFRCPMAEQIVRNTVNRALQRDPTLAAGLLRMHFHDCFVEGCDGSVLIDSTEDNTAEKDSAANLSLRGYEVIDEAKEIAENLCPGVVSCADILAMAARDAVVFSGGPLYRIPKGRKDGWRSRIEDTRNLPSPNLNASTLIRMFRDHGFNAQELVALSGGHTLGVARCSFFKNRLNNFDSTHDVDPSLDSSFANTLKKACGAGDNMVVSFDTTNNQFDNVYFDALHMGNGVLTSDSTLFTNAQTRVIVDAYSMDQARFFFDFQQAMVKMGLLNIKYSGQGEVRFDCRSVN